MREKGIFVERFAAIWMGVLLTLVLSGCVPGKYQVKLIPEPGMNADSSAALRVDLVWVTATTLNELRNLEGMQKGWFGTKEADYRRQGLVVEDEVLPGDYSWRYLHDSSKATATSVLVPPVQPASSEPITGFILFATYGENDEGTLLDGMHVVPSPKLYFWPWGTYEEEVILGRQRVTTAAERALEASEAAAVANASESAGGQTP